MVKRIIQSVTVKTGAMGLAGIVMYEELATELARYKAAIAEAAKKPQEDEIFYLFHLDCYNKGWKDAVEFIEGAIKEVTE